MIDKIIEELENQIDEFSKSEDNLMIHNRNFVLRCAIEIVKEIGKNSEKPCNTCRYYNTSKKLYSDECQFCRRYYADYYEQKE